MQILVNGEPRECVSPLTVSGLLAMLGVEARQAAVERNGEIVSRSQHADTGLSEGDRIEIVRFIGGG